MKVDERIMFYWQVEEETIKVYFFFFFIKYDKKIIYF